MPKLIILNIKYGQLGNRLYTFASCIALAKEYGYKIMNLCFEEYQQYFASTQNKPFVCWPEHFVFLKNNFLSKKINTFIYRLFFSNKWCRRLSSFIHVIDIDDLDNIAVGDTRLTEALSSKKTIIIKSWDLRFPELVHKYREDILGYFQPIKEVEKELDEYFAELRSRYELIIGIHMRGGDYKEFMGGRYYYSVEAYSKIITHLNDVYKSKKVGFLIASNERVEQKDLPNVNIEFGPGSEITDLYALARCDLFLGPPSSFDTWASFYGAVPYYRIWDAARLPQPEDFKVNQTV